MNDNGYEAYERLRVDWAAPGVLRVTISTPGKLNAVDMTGHRELAEIWRDVDADDEVHDRAGDRRPVRRRPAEAITLTGKTFEDAPFFQGGRNRISAVQERDDPSPEADNRDFAPAVAWHRYDRSRRFPTWAGGAAKREPSARQRRPGHAAC